MSSYNIQRVRIVYEVLNTEVIVVDFNTGNYYALIHVAKQIWQLIENQVPLDQIARLIADHYKLELGKVLDDVHPFIQRLLEIGLIEEATPTSSTDPVQIESHVLDYEPPRVQEYTDVQNLLLLDPIHEVTEAGWPDKG